MNRRTFASILTLAVVSACQSDPGSSPDGAALGYQPGDGTVTIIDSDERHAAPVLEGETLDGERISTANFAGRVIVVNVWGSWCPPCRKEAPELKKAADEMGDVQFLGINTRDLDPAPAKAFVRSFELDFPHLYDPDGALLLGFGELPPAAIPSTLVIDEEGRVAARILGESNATTFVGVVEQVREDA